MRDQQVILTYVSGEEAYIDIIHLALAMVLLMRMSKIILKIEPLDRTEVTMVEEVLEAVNKDRPKYERRIPSLKVFVNLNNKYPMWYSILDLASSLRQLLSDVIAAA